MGSSSSSRKAASSANSQVLLPELERNADKTGSTLDAQFGQGSGAVVRFSFAVVNGLDRLSGLFGQDPILYDQLPDQIQKGFAEFRRGFLIWAVEVARSLRRTFERLHCAQHDILDIVTRARTSQVRPNVDALRQRLFQALQISELEKHHSIATTLSNQAQQLVKQLTELSAQTPASEPTKTSWWRLALSIALVGAGIALCLTGVLAPLGAAGIAGGVVAGAAVAGGGVAMMVHLHGETENKVPAQLDQALKHIQDIHARINGVDGKLSNLNGPVEAMNDISTAQTLVDCVQPILALVLQVAECAEQELRAYHDAGTAGTTVTAETNKIKEA